MKDHRHSQEEAKELKNDTDLNTIKEDINVDTPGKKRLKHNYPRKKLLLY